MRDRSRGRVRKFIAKIEQAIPEARETSPEVRVRGRDEPATIDAFMEDVLRNMDAYWVGTLRAAGLPEPRVGYEFIPPYRAELTGCGISVGSDAAFYCPTDDTNYVSQQFAADLYEGVLRGLPGRTPRLQATQADEAEARPRGAGSTDRRRRVALAGDHRDGCGPWHSAGRDSWNRLAPRGFRDRLDPDRAAGQTRMAARLAATDRDRLRQAVIGADAEVVALAYVRDQSEEAVIASVPLIK